MSKPTLEFHTPGNAWTENAPGTWVMTLAEDADTADRTLFQRYKPEFDGSHGPVLNHTFIDEVFVIEGELTDVTLGVTFGPGMYACRPPGMPHGPYFSAAGCLMFVMIRNVPI